MPAVAAGFENGRSEPSSKLFPAAFLFAPLVTVAAPRLTPLLLLLVALALFIAAYRRRHGLRELLAPSLALGACLAFGVYVFINATWSLDQDLAYAKAGVLLGTVLIGFAGTAAAATVDDRQIRRASIAFVVGVSLGAIYLLIELSTKGTLTSWAMNTVDLLRPDSAKHASIVAGEVVRLSRSEFNQNVTVLTLAFWPGLLVLSALPNVPRRGLLVAAFFVLFTLPIAISEHDSSQIGIFLSVLALLLAWRWRRAVVKALAVLWCAAFVLVIPADLLAYREQLHLANWLPNSARARIIIWQYTAERALENPVLGIGVDSTATLRDQEKKIAKEKPKGFVFKRATGQHAHNIFLQTWFELGFVGAVLLALAGVAVALRIVLLPLGAQPYGVATFTAFAVVATFAWGMWQTWFICAIGLTPLYLRVAAALTGPRAAKQQE
ncbi:MAG: O-antigen ligase family protein [Methyloceanibacter sp.]